MNELLQKEFFAFNFKCVERFIEPVIFVSDAIRLWNGAPHSIKNCLTAYQAKKEIKAYIKTLPV